MPPKKAAAMMNTSITHPSAGELSAIRLIEKLEGARNYDHWSVLMRQYLRVEKLWDTIEAPLGGVLNEDPDKMNATLLRIFLSLEKTPLGLIERETSPKEAWQRLKELYLYQSNIGLEVGSHLMDKLKATHLENFPTCDEFLAAMQRGTYAYYSTEEMGDVKAASIDASLKAFLLMGLPSEYHSLHRCWLSPTGEVSAVEFMRRIREKWYRDNRGENLVKSDDDNASESSSFRRRNDRPYWRGAQRGSRKRERWSRY